MYRWFMFTLITLIVITAQLAVAQEDDALDAAVGLNGPSDVDPKSSDANGESGAEEAKPKTDKQRKTTYKEERFEKLFSTRNRKPRLPPPKYNLKPKPTLPSYFKSAPNVKPLAELDEPTVRSSSTAKPKKASGRVSSPTTTTTTQSPLSARNKNLRNSSSSSHSSSKQADHAKSSHNESTESSRKRFTSGRGRSTPSRGRSSSNTN